MMLATQRKGDWIQTASAGQFWPLDPQPDDVNIKDIAASLSRLCRYTGHLPLTESPLFSDLAPIYSVAQHSVLVSRHVSPDAALWGLLHDAAEAYLNDLSRPLKRCLRQLFGDALDRIEEAIAQAIRERYRVPYSPEIAEEVHRADVLVLVTEARDVMAPLHPAWHHREENGYEVIRERIIPWSPRRAQNAFMTVFHHLTNWRYR
jgi:hypothetical protein